MNTYPRMVYQSTSFVQYDNVLEGSETLVFFVKPSEGWCGHSRGWGCEGPRIFSVAVGVVNPVEIRCSIGGVRMKTL